MLHVEGLVEEGGVGVIEAWVLENLYDLMRTWHTFNRLALDVPLL